jgi:REP element-mobilizing transposase RayT
VPRDNLRRSPRLAGFDYSLTNAFFITITTHQKVPRFGVVRDSAVILNDAGRTVDRFWRLIPMRFPSIRLDIHVVMPDHLHGLLMLSGERVERPTLPGIMQWFKTWTTNEYATGVREMGWESFEGKIWHRGYHDHICRDDADIERIRTYIRDNPARRWQQMQVESKQAAKR